MSLPSSTTSIRFLPGLVLLVVELNAAIVGRALEISLMPLQTKIQLNTELYVIPIIYLSTDYSSVTLRSGEWGLLTKFSTMRMHHSFYIPRLATATHHHNRQIPHIVLVIRRLSFTRFTSYLAPCPS